MHLAADMAVAFGAVDAHGFTQSVPEHAKDLSVFLAIFFKEQLSLLVVRLILS